MTLWLEIPAMLARRTRPELIEMRKTSGAHLARFRRATGAAAKKECVDAGRMIEKIRQELEIRRKARALMQ